MIKLLTEDKIDSFLSFCENNIIGAVLYTRLKAYSTKSDILFWYSENEGKINGVCSLFDGAFTYFCSHKEQEDEFIIFSEIIGAKEITSAGRFILKYDKKAPITAEIITGENLRFIFPVIFEKNSQRDSFFDSWYTDVSHKLRHGLIHGYGIFEDNKCLSCALTSGETPRLSVISSVATLKQYRKRGYGERCVTSLASSLSGDVYLMTNDEKISNYYKKIGFKILERKDSTQ